MCTLRSTHIVALAALAMAACSSQDPGAIHWAGPEGPQAGAPTESPSDTATPPPGPAPTSTPTMRGDGGAPPADDGGASSDAGHEAAVDAGIDAPTGLAVLSFTLLDTSQTGNINGTPVAGYDPIPPNSTISLAAVGTNLSVRANVGTTLPGSVGFNYNGTNHTENAAPFTLCGDNGAGTVTNCNLTAGPWTVMAMPYSQAGLTGIEGNPLTITFTLAQ